MLQLLMTPRTARTVRSLIGAVVETAADAIRSVIAPATLVAEQDAPTVDIEAPAVVEAPDPAGLYEPDEIPAVEAIETAAREYERAADQARRADRGKRASKKILDRLPAGVYGAWKVFRTPSSPQTPDLAAITATYKELGLGPVPMKDCAPSLEVERVVPSNVETLAGVAA
ncbi:hypothetical protein [Streptomyces sp. NPDC058252]|uniref:hypothetical protein n=1 Tax=Streptomyces sp. NPDC058252 TaxID=3346405 RepID=UPI0036E6D4DA